MDYLKIGLKITEWYRCFREVNLDPTNFLVRSGPHPSPHFLPRKACLWRIFFVLLVRNGLLSAELKFRKNTELPRAVLPCACTLYYINIICKYFPWHKILICYWMWHFLVLCKLCKISKVLNKGLGYFRNRVGKRDPICLQMGIIHWNKNYFTCKWDYMLLNEDKKIIINV